jgi:hypothetical protein
MPKIITGILPALALYGAHAEQVLPLPPEPQSIKPNDGPKARQRLKLLRDLFGPEASSVPLACRFSQVVDCGYEDCTPPYKARNLALDSVTDGQFGQAVSAMLWTDGAKPNNQVLATAD